MQKFSEEMQKYIVDNYYNKTAKELAAELDVSYQYIKKIWTKFGMKGKVNTGKSNNLVNQTFGYLTVIAKSNRRSSNGSIYWICKCDCGRPNCLKQKEIIGQHLKTGRTISCGAVGAENLNNGRGLNFKDLTNQRFGKLTVIKRVENKIINNSPKVQWLCKCDCGRESIVLADNLKNGNTKSCGYCGNNSHGNIKISQILTQNNIPFEQEKRFDTCKDKTYLPFDFYVNNSYLIEFDGIQHFKQEGTIFNYELTHAHDLIKTNWCKENNIPLIRIQYTHCDNLCLEDLLLETSNFIEK